MTLEILQHSQGEALEILDENMMEQLVGGDEICKRKYSTSKVKCKLGYSATDSGTIICNRGYAHKGK